MPHLALNMPNKAAAVAGLMVELGRVQVSFKTDNGESAVALLLELRGSYLRSGKGYRIVITEAKDEAGKSLKQDESFLGEFSSLNDLSGVRPQSIERTIGMGLRSSSEPKVLASLIGYTEIVVPEKDPSSVVTVGFAKHVGVPLQDPALRAAGVEITLEPLQGGPTAEKQNDPWFLIYQSKDPAGKLVGEAEFFDAVGQKLTISGANATGRAASGTTKATHFKTTPPADVVVKFCLATGQSVVRVPFAFENVPAQPRK